MRYMNSTLSTDIIICTLMDIQSRRVGGIVENEIYLQFYLNKALKENKKKNTAFHWATHSNTGALNKKIDFAMKHIDKRKHLSFRDEISRSKQLLLVANRNQ